MVAALQDKLGLELDSLIEDAQNASVRVIAAEAHAKLARGAGGQEAAQAIERSTWISPAPSSVKMRLFCLPYAGGISENVYGRCVSPVLPPPPPFPLGREECTAATVPCTNITRHKVGKWDPLAKCALWSVAMCRWAQMLPASIQVCPIELPGRGRRRNEVGIADVATLADALADSLPLKVSPAPTYTFLEIFPKHSHL